MKLIKDWFPPIFYAALILFLGTRAHLAALPEISGFDKIMHALEFAVFSLLWLRALSHTFPKLSRGWVMGTILLAALYGLGIEWLQSFIPGRECSLGDEVANIFGAALGCWGFLKWHR